MGSKITKFFQGIQVIEGFPNDTKCMVRGNMVWEISMYDKWNKLP
jgi:hypothetical protein